MLIVGKRAKERIEVVHGVGCFRNVVEETALDLVGLQRDLSEAPLGRVWRFRRRPRRKEVLTQRLVRHLFWRWLPDTLLLKAVGLWVLLQSQIAEKQSIVLRPILPIL